MESTVLEAPKLYLDTCHLSRIANLRKGARLATEEDSRAYALIDECIRERHFGLIFSSAAPLEWVEGNATLKSACEKADVIDSALLQYELEGDEFVYLREVLAELQRLCPNLSLPDFDILFVRHVGEVHTRAMSVLVNSVPGFFEEGELGDAPRLPPLEVPIISAREQTYQAMRFKNENRKTFDERVDGEKAAFHQNNLIFQNRRRKGINPEDRTSWMKKFLRVDRVVSSLNPGVNVDDLLRRVDLANCPAVDLFLKAYGQRLRAGNKPKDTDVGDWMYIPVVPYADLVLSERNLTHFACAAKPELRNKMTHDPSQFTQFLKKWL